MPIERCDFRRRESHLSLQCSETDARDVAPGVARLKRVERMENVQSTRCGGGRVGEQFLRPLNLVTEIRDPLHCAQHHGGRQRAARLLALT